MAADTTPVPTDALLPCPFCGCDARNDAHADDCYFVLHRKLNAQPEADLSMHLEVLAAWNRRAQPAPAASPAPMTDKQAHALLMRMAEEADQWSEGLSCEPTAEQVSAWCVAFIMREAHAAHGIKEQ